MTWKVTINFGGFFGAENDYYVEADTRDEAEELALEEAHEDICVVKAKNYPDGGWIQYDRE